MVAGLSVFGDCWFSFSGLLIYCIRIIEIQGNVDLCWQNGLFSGEYLFILQDGGIRGSVDLF